MLYNGQIVYIKEKGQAVKCVVFKSPADVFQERILLKEVNGKELVYDKTLDLYTDKNLTRKIHT